MKKTFQSILMKEFPACVKDSKIDRGLLASQVFSNKKSLERLNALTHPAIMETLKNEMLASNHDYVFAEVPLLFEGNYQDDFDFVIVVNRNLKDRILAVAERDGASVESIQKRISSQWDYDNSDNLSLLSKSKYVIIQNSDSVSELNEKIEKALNLIMKQ